MLLIAIAAFQAATMTPSPETRALGIRLARTTGLAAIAPALIERDLAELAGEDRTLDAAARERLLAIGRAQAAKGLDRIVAAVGAGYASRLSLADLKTLVAQSESPAAARWRTVEPAVIAQAAATIGAMDLKRDTAAAFCRETGKLCARR